MSEGPQRYRPFLLRPRGVVLSLAILAATSMGSMNIVGYETTIDRCSRGESPREIERTVQGHVMQGYLSRAIEMATFSGRFGAYKSLECAIEPQNVYEEPLPGLLR